MKNKNMLVFPGVDILQKPLSKLPIVEKNIIITKGNFFYSTFCQTWKLFITSTVHTKFFWLVIFYIFNDMITSIFLQIQDPMNLKTAKA